MFLIKLLALPLIIAVTLIQWVAIFLTSFSAILFDLLAGIIFMITLAGLMFGVCTGMEALKMLAVSFAIFIIPQIAEWLIERIVDLNCIPDQVNWNHPNIHCTNDSYYAQWNKGFKLRILLDQYAQFGAFAFRTKAETSNENRRLQRETHAAERCETRDMHFTPSTVHPAENDTRLPELIRGGHYIHFRHFCTVMGCEHAPYCKIREQFEHIGELINPFPILHKDSYIQIEEIIQADPLLSGREYTSCQADGDAVDFVSQLFQLPSKEAAMKIADDFGIAYDNRQKPTVKPHIREPTPEQKYRQEEMHCYKVLCEYFHLLQKWEQQYAPQTPEDDLHPLFVEALQRKSYTEYLLDSFLDGSPEERREIVAQQGKEVMKLEQRIAEWTAAGTLHRGTGQKQPGTDRER